MHILGSIGAIIIGLLTVPQLINWWEAGNTATQQRLVANHMLMVSQAASSYMNRHQDVFLSQASENAGPTVSIDDLISEGFLPEGFQRRNGWLQEYQIHVRQPQSGSLQSIVLTTGGRAHESDKFINATVPGAAALVGGAGGFVPSGQLPGQSDATLMGAGRGWQLDLASVGIPSPGPGHLGAVSTYDPSGLGQDFLYRVSVPGQPELNAMQTDLDMTDHAIKGVSDLQFEERQITGESCSSPEDQGRMFLDPQQGLYLCRNYSLEIIGDSGNSQALKNAVVAKSGERVTKPVCAPGTGTKPAIYTAPSLAEAGPNAPPLTSIQTWATSLSDTEW